MKTAAIDNYLKMREQLFVWREEHGKDTPEEDMMLDSLEELWLKLSQPEIESLNKFLEELNKKKREI